MKQLVFMLVDKNYQRCEGLILSPSASIAIRDNAPYLSKVHKYFLDDYELREIGEVMDDLSIYTYSEPRIVDWNECKNPEVLPKPLTEEEKKDLQHI